MDWYYARGTEQIGPIPEDMFASRVADGTITPETLVWREGMPTWQAYDTLIAGPVPPPVPPMSLGGSAGVCAECRGRFPLEEMVPYQEYWICAGCKPRFFQRLREGAPLPGRLQYGGFWVRFGAKFIDGIIINVLSVLSGTILGLVSALFQHAPIFILNYPIMIAISLAYGTVFVGAFGATPGKLALGLRVVRPDGERVSYGRAFCRYLAETLSGMIMGIGYIMAAFDDEKRTLHDRICDTRVVQK